MAILVDTGVLLRAFDASCAQYRPIRRSIRTLWNRQELLVVALQNPAEFWNVSTRPVDKNGYGLSIERVRKHVAEIELFCLAITEDDRSFAIWKDLVSTYSVTGVAAHDARLVSIMLVHGISTVITLNERDFRRDAGITAVTPDQIGSFFNRVSDGLAKKVAACMRCP